MPAASQGVRSWSRWTEAEMDRDQPGHVVIGAGPLGLAAVRTSAKGATRSTRQPEWTRRSTARSGVDRGRRVRPCPGTSRIRGGRLRLPVRRTPILAVAGTASGADARSDRGSSRRGCPDRLRRQLVRLRSGVGSDHRGSAGPTGRAQRTDPGGGGRVASQGPHRRQAAGGDRPRVRLLLVLMRWPRPSATVCSDECWQARPRRCWETPTYPTQ